MIRTSIYGWAFTTPARQTLLRAVARTQTFARVKTGLLIRSVMLLVATIGPFALQGHATAELVPSPPRVRILKPPDFPGEYAIWGATGVDRSGHIFFGMTSNDTRGSGSAHLFELNPASDTFTDRGEVVAELERLQLRRPGETQMKIHSRIVQAIDGYQYFSSMDET